MTSGINLHWRTHQRLADRKEYTMAAELLRLAPMQHTLRFSFARRESNINVDLALLRFEETDRQIERIITINILPRHTVDSKQYLCSRR